MAARAFAWSAHVRSGGAGIVLDILPVTGLCDIGVIGLTRQVREHGFVGLKWVLLGLLAPNTFVQQETGFGWTGMFKLDEKVFDVAGHTDATPAGRIVPFDVITHKFVAGHVELDPLELLENIAEMVEVFYPNILHPKVMNNEAESDGTPFVAPEAWGGFSLIISFGKKVGLEEIVGKNLAQGRP